MTTATRFRYLLLQLAVRLLDRFLVLINLISRPVADDE